MGAGDWIDAVIAFWFDELTPEDWFKQKDVVDETIRTRFSALYEEVKAGVPAEAREDARTALATIILLDQFPRNMFRGEAAAFGSDTIASSLARHAVDSGLDAELTPEKRRFLYMPLMHSEVLADQERSVSLFRSLGDENSLSYAVEHRDVIARFGRFPHRNQALGRQSSASEKEYLEDASSYGQ